jgi:hypothetical protein
MRKPLRNIGASIRARLLNLAKKRNQPFDLLLTRYVLERLLYRLSLTRYREQFIPKGAILTTTWFADPLRPTRDLDLLAQARRRQIQQAASNIAGMKKPAMAEAAEQRLAGTGWLPELLRNGATAERAIEQAT